MNLKTVLLVDSSNSMSLEEAKKNNIHILPLNLIDNENNEFLNSLEINEIAGRMLNENTFFKTSTTPLGIFVKEIEKLLKEYDRVVYLTISSALSSQNSQAHLILEEFPKDKFIIINSKTAAYHYEKLSLELNKMIQNNQFSIEKAEKLVDDFTNKATNYFTCSELKYIAKSGRGGKKLLQYNLTSKLFKPIIAFREKNSLESISFNLKGALNKVIKGIKNFIKERPIEYIGVYDGWTDSHIFKNFIENLAKSLNISKEQILIKNVPTIVFAHTGPGTYGIFVKVK